MNAEYIFIFQLNNVFQFVFAAPILFSGMSLCRAWNPLAQLLQHWFFTIQVFAQKSSLPRGHF